MTGNTLPPYWSDGEPDYLALGWPWPITQNIEFVAREMSARGIADNILKTDQYLAIEWLMEVTPGIGSTTIPPTKRGEVLFVALSQVRIFFADEAPSISDLLVAIKAFEEAVAAMKSVKQTLFEVPEPIKRFGYDVLVTQTIGACHSNLGHRLESLRKELKVLSEISGVDLAQETGRSRNWKPRLLLRVASQIYYNVTGYRPARRLPVRSFEGFFKRFCADIPEMERVNWRRLAEEAINDPQMAGEFIPFDSVEHERLSLGIFPKMRVP